MNAMQNQMLPTLDGIAELMGDLSPRALEVNVECLRRIVKVLFPARSAC
jgi:hypothetical protein